MQERSNVRKNSTQLAGQMARGLVDDMMMARYGTSLEVGMTREYQNYLHDKYNRLKAEFDEVNKDSNEYISLEELTEFFTKYSKDVEIIFNLLYRMESHMKNNILKDYLIYWIEIKITKLQCKFILY